MNQEIAGGSWQGRKTYLFAIAFSRLQNSSKGKEIDLNYVFELVSGNCIRLSFSLNYIEYLKEPTMKTKPHSLHYANQLTTKFLKKFHLFVNPLHYRCQHVIVSTYDIVVT